MSQKKANVANFNVVFLENDDEAPLLKYFLRFKVESKK